MSSLASMIIIVAIIFMVCCYNIRFEFFLVDCTLGRAIALKAIIIMSYTLAVANLYSPDSLCTTKTVVKTIPEPVTLPVS